MFYIEKWRNYLSKEVQSSKQMNDPFELLTHLWAHKNVIKDLQKIRLNPNLINKNRIRNDLEFYIPQLCSFMLFGEYEAVQEFFSFLCKSCYASFSFAHRIIWFLKSSIGKNPQTNEKIKNVLTIIQMIFKSDFDKNRIENFYLCGSEEYVKYLKNENLQNYYFKEINNKNEIDNEINNIENVRDFIMNKKKFHEFLSKYAEFTYNKEIEKEGLKTIDNSNNNNNINNNNLKDNEMLNQIKNLNPNQFSLNLFKNYDHVTNDENSIHLQYIKQIDLDDVNLSSFLSNINFFDHLCNICDILINTQPNERKKVLLNEIHKINKILPANVYLPFLNSSIRNYLIGGISISECHIFKTKERAPYMITMECFRLDELNYFLLNHPIGYLKLNKMSPTEDDNYHKVEGEESNKNVLKLTLNNDFEIIPKIKKKKTMFNFLTTVENDNNENIEKNQFKKKDMYLYENEIKYSKPIVINDLLYNNNNNNKNHKKKIFSIEINNDNNINNNNNLIYNELSPIQNIEKRFSFDSTIINNAKILSERKNNQIDNEIKNNFSNQKGKKLNISLELNNSNSSSSDNEDSSRSDETKDISAFNILLQNSKNNNNQYNSNTLSNIANQINEDSKDYFGESIIQQTARLRKNSPFGFLTSYKLYNVIIKSGEDLRQEQFASQLINEFRQIFKFEKVKCWVYPYEIIATGTDVGIIEVVPNSISIDQMKRKSKNNISLREFYESYFGPINSPLYKRAMKNYIKSLAGYSLVCYFLQIKDRHNGNIMIDNKGHLIHIDFGFMLSNAPGKGLKFENAPFKLTNDFVEVLGGTQSKYFNDFRKLLWKGFIACVNHYEKILILVEMMFCGHGNKLPSFEGGQNAINELKQRFLPRPNMKKRDYIAHVDKLIEMSIDNWRTNWYDRFQYLFQGIMA